MQLELKALQRQLGITFIFVTHDQQEALSMSDRICIFNQGKIEQIAAPDTIYDAPPRPSSLASSAPSTCSRGAGPPSVRRCSPDDGAPGADPAHRGRHTGLVREVREVEYLGPFVRYRVDLGEQLELIVNHPNEARPACPVAPGSASAGRSRRSITCTPPSESSTMSAPTVRALP